MKKVKLDASQLASIVSEKATGITAHFDNLMRGSTPTQRTPLYHNSSIELNSEDVCERWKKVLLANKAKYPRLIEYEDTRWEKFGPQGGYPPFDERWEDIEKYFDRIRTASVINSPDYPKLCSVVRQRLFGKTHDLRALTPEDVLHRDIEEDKVNSNSGLPDFSKRADEQVQFRAVQDAKSGKWREYPAVLGSRSIRQKPRFIFMFPMSTNLVEKCFVVPIMDKIRNNNVLSFSAWEGFDDVEQAFYKQETWRGSTLISMDYTGMDQTMGPDQMQIIYDIVSPVFQPKYRDLLRESLSHATQIPIMYDSNHELVGTHGLASGSGWTNLSESIMSEFVHELINQSVPLIGNQLLGDDGAMSTSDNKSDIAQVIAECSELCGLEANPEKQDISSNTLHYLQRFFDKDIFIEGSNVVAGSYPTVLALNAGMNPERFHDSRKWSGRMEILRWIMILENCKHHPLFHDIIDFFIKGDKFNMGLSIPGYFKRHIYEDYKVSKTIKGFVPSYNQASIDRGIDDFEVVKYLRSKKRAS